jgi:hypothetical protein
VHCVERRYKLLPFYPVLEELLEARFPLGACRSKGQSSGRCVPLGACRSKGQSAGLCVPLSLLCCDLEIRSTGNVILLETSFSNQPMLHQREVGT